MKELTWVVSALQDEAIHFLLAFFVGLLAYWLTWIILSVLWRVTHRGNPTHMSSVVAYGITIIALLLGVALALLSHLLWDGLSLWLVTPLGKPLNLLFILTLTH